MFTYYSFCLLRCQGHLGDFFSEVVLETIGCSVDVTPGICVHYMRFEGPLRSRDETFGAAGNCRNRQSVLLANSILKLEAAMKGVILVGGLGTRLAPMTLVTNKHLLPVGRFPMVYYPLHALCEAGIDEVILITGGNSPGAFLELLHDGSDFGLKTLYYAYQHAPQGIADALRLAKAFVGGDDCIVMLGDNVVDSSLKCFVEGFRNQGGGARILLTEVEDPERFGVPEFDSTGQIIRLHEKPETPPSRYAVIGIYAYDAQLWEILPTLQLSPRGQYEITDVNNIYLGAGQLQYDIFLGNWSDAGTPESLYRASQIAWASSFVPCPGNCR